ncbi:hypothetical protein [Bdellovibrio sp. HCB2-146]|uniref:hypothetical protein n=1 Tax=Bdellovibrio sp. HCB2-146 TaxID=3394362 RepID=UPI0039BC8123
MRAIWMSMILSSMAILGPSISIASSDICAQVLDDTFDFNGRIIVEEKAQRGPRLQEYQERLMLVESLLGNLKRPTETRVTVGHLTIFSVFDRNDFSVYVGIQPQTASWKRSKVDLDTLNHEYAHAIFEKNLLASIPQFRDQYAAIDARARENDPAVILYTALHELFADIVTVVTTKNPDTFPELLAASPEALKSFELGVQDSHREFTFEELNYRSMTLGAHPGALKSWSSLLKQTESKQHPYFLLLPARWKFWGLVRNKISSASYQKQIIERVFPILSQEVERMLEFSQDSLSEADVQALNYRLMKSLEQVL